MKNTQVQTLIDFDSERSGAVRGIINRRKYKVNDFNRLTINNLNKFQLLQQLLHF